MTLHPYGGLRIIEKYFGDPVDFRIDNRDMDLAGFKNYIESREKAAGFRLEEMTDDMLPETLDIPDIPCRL